VVARNLPPTPFFKHLLRRAYTLDLPDGRALELGRRTLVMGILNVTPDSFADGGACPDTRTAVERALAMEAEGADIIDVGGESTRPGADVVPEDEERRRVLPVIAALSGRLGVPVSVDTYKAGIASAALAAGAVIVNDISGLRYDPGLGEVVADKGAALVLMHTRGRSSAMYAEAVYNSVTDEVARELEQSIDRAVSAGVGFERLVLDPGIGFAKNAAHSLEVIASLASLAGLDRPLLAGPSRKSFLTRAVGPREPLARDWATAGAVALCVFGGAHIVRVHNVAAMRDVVDVADAIVEAAGAGCGPREGDRTREPF
jgi:dihydropteroate synthase